MHDSFSLYSRCDADPKTNDEQCAFTFVSVFAGGEQCEREWTTNDACFDKAITWSLCYAARDKETAIVDDVDDTASDQETRSNSSKPQGIM